MRPEELLREAAEKLRGLGPTPVIEAKRLLVLGDTHGYPEVTRWALELADEEAVEAIVLLGDYVDRGPGGVENLELVAEELLARGPRRLLPLRGNHEDLEMNMNYGFYRQAIRKRGPEYIRVLEEKFYPCLPLAAKAGPLVLLHGGIPCSECTRKPEPPATLWEPGSPWRRELEERWCRLRSTYTGSRVARHLLWNDPNPRIEWFEPNVRGPDTHLYGWRAWQSFLEANQAQLLIRGHEVSDAGRLDRPGERLEGLPDGWREGLDELRGSVVTVFSSLYHGMGAGAAIVDLREGMVELRRYPRLR